ncbi:hypothetical protein GCM10010168_50240 [Actinoplanes ianthinogenes]|uniref:WXG100 family type VII secretion target n=1 Tax=Actinoplanes ianthinogenes TaxID=122358 RepID=A0ABM7M3I7_9ACTN|nr:hypothetical protein [Actinoplanes ianthinogenes]BCJ46076.1 hypothetical protein Aiant_67330 [Actinoplanes ianthinogenes]GGR26037.1 hypothetical protein GCM10010168_50240 [Actinoplanes ianthinogenes]
MSEYLSLPQGPAAAAQVGTKLQAEAQDFKEKAQRVLADIQALDQKRPWGGDEAGKAFEQQYHKPMGEAGTLAQALQDRLDTAGDMLDKLGGNVVQAMTQYDVSDQAGATDIAGAV